MAKTPGFLDTQAQISQLMRSGPDFNLCAPFLLRERFQYLKTVHEASTNMLAVPPCLPQRNGEESGSLLGPGPCRRKAPKSKKERPGLQFPSPGNTSCCTSCILPLSTLITSSFSNPVTRYYTLTHGLSMFLSHQEGPLFSILQQGAP